MTTSSRFHDVGPPGPPPAGRVGRYRLEAELGSGATGTVWRARLDPGPGPPGPVVALKRLRAGGGVPGADLRHEATVLLDLDHPHIVRVVEVVADADGVALAMQYAPGGSLLDLLDGRGHLRPREVVAVATPIAEALASAHRHGVIHGDVTAANVLFTSEGEPLLCDFGVARWIRAAGTGPAVGTPGYAAPEVAAGAPPTVAADVFSLGALCHEALTGRLPDDDPGGRALRGRTGIPDPLAAVIDRAHASDPGLRFASCEDLARALRAAVSTEAVVLPVVARPAGPSLTDWSGPVRLTRTFGPRPPASPEPGCHRRRGILVALAAAVFSVVAGAGVAAALLGPERTPAATASMRACPAAARPAAPAGAVLLLGDPDGDGCDGWAAYVDQVLAVALSPGSTPRRYRVGRPGDVVLLGDWDCNGVDTPGLYRTSTGRILYFDDWDTTGAGLPPSATGAGDPGGEASLSTTDDGCDAITVTAPNV